MENLILFEYVTSNPSKEFLKNQGLLSEGIKMIDKLSFDFQKNKKIKKVSVIRNTRLNFKKYKKINYFLTKKKNDWLNILQSLDPSKTKVLLIAPETFNTLELTLKKINMLGFKVLCSNIKTIQKFSSKDSIYDNLIKKGIPCAETFQKVDEVKEKENKFIIKPKVSSGSENVNLVENFVELSHKLKKINFPYVIQYYKPKIIGSFSMICFKGKNIVLGCNKQIVQLKDNKIRQVGSFIGKYEKYRKDYRKIANLISTSFPGLFGYIGVDVVFEDNRWKVLEINPRFTTSYTGLDEVYGAKITAKIIDFYCENKIGLIKSVKIKKSKKLLFK